MNFFEKVLARIHPAKILIIAMVVASIAFFVGIISTIGETRADVEQKSQTIAQLRPADVPIPAPYTPVPNDRRQPLIPGSYQVWPPPVPSLSDPEAPTTPTNPTAPAIAPLPAQPPTHSEPSELSSASPSPTTTSPTTLVLPPGYQQPYPIMRELPNSRYTPQQEYIPANPTNYGYRFITDVRGNLLNNAPIIVIHETVGSANSALNMFRQAIQNDADQRSYHALIRRNGNVVYIVPPEYRAFGAGNSVFVGPNGPEAVSINPAFPPSVNNFAYHISLETPPDGRGNGRRHSGYTQAQYQSLAWLVARTGIPQNRVTTHRAVDRSGTRIDPRSFDSDRFLTLLKSFSANQPA